MSLLRLFLYITAILLYTNTATAKYCVKLPSCEELGYIFSAKDYPHNRSVKCPFDTDKILLLDYCQAYGLTSCDSTAGECDECIVKKANGTKSNSGYWRYVRCNAGYSYKSGECIRTEIDRTRYPFEDETPNEELGKIECVQSGDKTYCGYTECVDGWDLVEGNCIVHECDTTQYPNLTCDTYGTCETCLSGELTKYTTPVCHTSTYWCERDWPEFVVVTDYFSGV